MSRAAHLGPAKRRPLVLDAALGLFAERGYAGVSMDDVAHAAGVTKPVVYACFDGGKAGLFRAVLDREAERMNDLLDAVSEAARGAQSVEDGLRAALAETFRLVAAEPDMFRVVYSSAHGADPEMAARVARVRARQEQRMVEQARTRLGGDDAAELAGRLIVAACEIGFRLMLEEPTRWTPDVLADRLARLLARGENG